MLNFPTPRLADSKIQHDHVYTIGKRPNERNVLSDAEELRRIGADVHKTRRGGDVTYHGPGQIVLYPILHLRESQIGARKYVETLEDIMIDTCACFGIEARGRVPEMTGTWVGDKKIGAVGVQISQGVTTHGLAFNRDPDLLFFKHIVSCGLPGKTPTSLANELRASTIQSMRSSSGSRAEVEAKMVHSFVSRFGYDDVSMHRE